MRDPKVTFGRLGNSLFQYAYIYGQARRGEIPDIFVQDPKYFDEFRDDIKELFNVTGTTDKIAVHVRRGINPINPEELAYSDNPFYVDLTKTDYYSKAIASFMDNDVKFLFFSDDIEWCKNHWKGLWDNHFEYSEGKTELEDLNLMASCKGIIMANSSYSWWAAYLSNARVVAPLAWYSDGVERTKCPKEWTRI